MEIELVLKRQMISVGSRQLGELLAVKGEFLIAMRTQPEPPRETLLEMIGESGLSD